MSNRWILNFESFDDIFQQFNVFAHQKGQKITRASALGNGRNFHYCGVNFVENAHQTMLEEILVWE